ncbi:transmembrane protein 106B-like [Salarias fasciatus]|uniref:Transmembrane protein 106B-like n=1 Tax=Salarias fasciatus TaxID=181472 RepID=A0A672GFH9_SALFA|nr:transmembrane protein 106B-like [Salarias fasciatus]XP_029945639.1 transmembrane protein 106B-like [Salarias fasciatus]
MGTAPSQSDGGEADGDDRQPIVSRRCSRRRSTAETVHCPTCQGIGRIPRGQESKLVAVIPCSDQRLRPRRTKLYVALSVAVCVLVSALVLFFLFPRSVLLSPVSVQSSYVFFMSSSVEMNITNVLNITNQNFAEVRVYNLTVQALNYQTVVGTLHVKDVTSVRPLSAQLFSFVMPVNLTDVGMREYCQNPALTVHIVYLHLQISVTVYYLAHYEQLSLDAYEFLDCGANATVPHRLLPPPT